MQLLLSYGFVVEDNPHDAMLISLNVPTSDPLFGAKSNLLSRAFDEGHFDSSADYAHLTASGDIPDVTLLYVRLYVLEKQDLPDADNLLSRRAVSLESERSCFSFLEKFTRQMLDGYPSSLGEDEGLLSDGSLRRGSQEWNIVQLRISEKRILMHTAKQARTQGRRVR